MRFVIVCVLLTIFAAARAGYPPNFPKCKNGDEACLVKGANYVIQNLYAGQSDINLIPIDPFHVKSIHLEKNPSSPVSIDLKLSDIEVTGFKTIKVTTFSGLKADLSGRSTFAGTISDLKLKGHHIIDGTVIVLPVKGEGNMILTCKNIKFKYTFDFKPIVKNGKTYATLEHVKLELHPETVQFNFDNLFNGDKTLTDTTNEFLNANWKEVYGELAEGISKSISLLVKSLTDKFYEKQPYADFFL